MPTASPVEIILDVDQFGSTDRKQVLGAFADGHYIREVFGSIRPLVAQSIRAHVQGIMPNRGDLIEHAFGYGHERRIAAYRNGSEYLNSVYAGYGEALPTVYEISLRDFS